MEKESIARKLFGVSVEGLTTDQMMVVSAAKLNELGKIDLENADLSNLTIEFPYALNGMLGSNLRNTNFSGSVLVNGVFGYANLEGACFKSTTVRLGSFREANLKGANFTLADVNHADFYMADLQDVKFYDANLQGAFMAWTKLSGAYFEYAHLGDVNLENANLQKCSLANTFSQGVKLRGAVLDSGYSCLGGNITVNNVDGCDGVLEYYLCGKDYYLIYSSNHKVMYRGSPQEFLKEDCFGLTKLRWVQLLRTLSTILGQA